MKTVVASYNTPFLLTLNSQLSNCSFFQVGNNAKMAANSNLELIFEQTFTCLILITFVRSVRDLYLFLN